MFFVMFDIYMQMRCKFNVFISFCNHFRLRFYQHAILFIIIVIIDKNWPGILQAASFLRMVSVSARSPLGVRFQVSKSGHRAEGRRTCSGAAMALLMIFELRCHAALDVGLCVAKIQLISDMAMAFPGF